MYCVGSSFISFASVKRDESLLTPLNLLFNSNPLHVDVNYRFRRVCVEIERVMTERQGEGRCRAYQ